MPAINVQQRRLKKRKGVQGAIETCDLMNCTKSGQYEAWILDHKYDKWLLCTEHKNEILETLKEILPYSHDANPTVVPSMPKVQPAMAS